MARSMRWAATVAMCAGMVAAINNGLGRVPQMGYNSWYDWQSNMKEDQLRKSVDAMVSQGLVDLGYTYFNLDDCWSKGRYANGSQFADPEYFPSGTLKPLADYAHSKGMKFGTYTDRGTHTCAGRPGALGHEKIDADTYASWGVDYLKEDSCNAAGDQTTAFAEYSNMSMALNSTGRPIFFSLCGWHDWYAPIGAKIANSWRIGPDDTNWHGVLANIDINANLAAYAAPGGWNDPCLLLAEEWTGVQRMTEAQTRAQFNMWAIMASPLLISANVINMSATNLATYKNKEVIAVNQDPLGKQGTRVMGGSLLDSIFTDDGVHRAHNTPASLTACNPKDAAQKWSENAPASGYFQNPSSKLCLNVDDCGSDLIYFTCVQSGGTCCGATCYNNMQFAVSGGQLTTPMHPGQCGADMGGHVTFGPCSAAAHQNWTFSETTGAISVTVGDTTTCLSTNVAPPTASPLNVWARPLSGGSWAAVFLNIGPNASDVTCDADCFAAMGIAASDQMVATDLWDTDPSPKPIPFTGAKFTAPNLAAEGGSAMYTFAKAAAAA